MKKGECIMAYSISSQSGTSTYGVMEYVVNSEADVASVPTDAASGSTILVIDTSNVYMLSVREDSSSEKMWKLVGS